MTEAASPIRKPKAMTPPPTPRSEPPSLRLAWRPTRLEDLPRFIPVLTDAVLFEDPARREALLSLWRHLISLKACLSVMIEDHRAPSRPRPVSFGISFFATDEFVRWAKSDMPPFLAWRVLELHQAGRRPFLLPEEIRRANRGDGLNVVILGTGLGRDNMDLSERSLIVQMNAESFFATHCGYRIKEMLQEVYGEEQRQWVTAGGLEPYRDYAEYRRDPPYGGWMAKLRPFLMGITARRALDRVGIYVINRLFVQSCPPRFSMLPHEQQLLEQSLLGLAEGETARALGISPNTVKKRWQAIYQKVEAADPQLLAAPGATEEERLRQRRRLLLDYLRLHPEEIRPY